MNHIYDYFGNQETGFSVLVVNGGYLIAGAAIDSSGVWQQRIQILHIDSLGNEVWKKSYGKANHQYYPGGGGAFVPTYDGGYALGGSVVKPNGNSDAILFKFDSNGDSLWTTMYGDTLFQIAYKCVQTSDSGYVLIGSTDNGTDNDIWLIKTDNLGNVIWQKMYGGINDQRGVRIDICNDGGYVIGGSTWSSSKGYDAYIIKTDSLGNQQWSKTFGGNYTDCGANIIQTSDRGYIFGMCESELVPPNLQPNFQRNYIYRLDSSGNVIWTKEFGELIQGGGTGFNGEFHELYDGSFFIAGQLADPQYGLRGWVLKISAQGDSLWDRRYDHFYESDDRFLNAIPTDDGGFIAVGDNFYSGQNDTGILAGNRQNLWLLKMDSCGCAYSGCDTICTGPVTGIDNLSDPDIEFSIYPNPANENVTIVYSLPSDIPRATVTIYNLMGKWIERFEITGYDEKILASTFALVDGIYFYKLTVNGKTKASQTVIIAR